MTRLLRLLLFVLGAATISLHAEPASTNTFTVAVYNVENWLSMDRRGATNAPKPEAERAAVVKVLGTIRPDVLGIVEMGTLDDLADLRARLKAQDMDFPHFEWIRGGDPTRHLALLSKFPITERNAHTNDTYELGDQHRRVERGILDARVAVTPDYSFRVLLVHFKSKRAVEIGDQAQMRLNEARILRGKLDAIVKADPHENFVVMGDFNDTPGSPPIEAITGTNGLSLFVLHPRDSKGYDTTHFWRFQKDPALRWSRIDYLMVSPGMSNEYVAGSAKINDPTGWLDASDHRPLSAQFHVGDRGTNLPHRLPVRP